MNKMWAQVYQAAETSDERDETVVALAEEYGVNEMEVRQDLQTQKVYVEKEGKTEKEQYAIALSIVTGVEAKEFMKLTFKAQKQLMDVFRGGNNE